MREHLRSRLLTTTALLILSVATLAARQDLKGSDGWVQRPADGAKTTVAFASIANPGMYDAYVVSVTADVADGVDIVQVSGGETRVIKELTIPAFGGVELSPDGVHLVLRGLKKPIARGDTVVFTLATDSGRTLTLEAPVK
jgi:copper(I)-binding protein